MGFLQQLRLLLHKNLLLRRRHPGLLLLEVVWPILIVAIVAVIRVAVPPVEHHTCHYQDRAMPSAGLVPFIQTFICNLDNKCHTRESRQSAQDNAASVSAVVQKVTPFLGKDETLEMLDSVDEGVVLMSSFNNLLRDNSLMTQLDDATNLEHYFREPDVLKKALLRDFSFSDGAVNALMAAQANISGLLDLSGFPDLRGVACDPKRLSRFLIFPDKADVTEVSRSLCHMNDSKIPELTLLLQHQLDVAEIIRLLGLFETMKDRLQIPDTMGQSLNDIADMLELVLSMDDLRNTVTQLITIKNLPDLVRKLPHWISQLKSSGSAVKTMEDLVKSLDPMVSTFLPEDSSWTSIKKGFALGSQLTDMGLMSAAIHRNSSSLVELMESVGVFLQKLEHALNGIPPENRQLLRSLSSVNWPRLWHVVSTYKGNNHTALLHGAEQLMGVLQATPIWSYIADYVPVASDMLRSTNLIMQQVYKVFEGLKNMMLSGNKHVQQAMETLLEKGPDVTLTVLRAFTRKEALTKLLAADARGFSAVCHKAVASIRKEVGERTFRELKADLCASEVSRAFGSVLAGFSTTQITAAMNATVIKIISLSQYHVKEGSVNLTALVQEIQTLTHNVKLVQSASGSWSQLFCLESVLSAVGQDIVDGWKFALSKMDVHYVKARVTSVLAVVIEKMEPLLTGNPGLSAWWTQMKRFTRIVHDISILVIKIDKQSMIESLPDMLEFYPQEVRHMVQLAADAFLELTDALKLMLFQPYQLLDMIATEGLQIPNCQHITVTHWLGLSPSSSFGRLESTLCTANWAHISEEMSRIPKAQPLMATMEDLIAQIRGEGQVPVINWQDAMIHVAQMVEIMTANVKQMRYFSSQWNLTPFNMTTINATWVQFYQDIQKLQQVDYVRLGKTFSSLQGLEMQLVGNNTELLHMLTVNSYLNLNWLQFLIKQLRYFQSRRQVVLVDMLGSDELRKLGNLLSHGPKVNHIIARTMIRLMENPVLASTFHLNSLCSNLTAFSQIVAVDDEVIDSSLLQQSVCSVSINFTVLTTQLIHHWDGFGQLFTAVGAAMQPGAVLPATNFSQIFQATIQYNQLLTSILKNPPEFFFIADQGWTLASLYQEPWKKFGEEVSKVYEKYQTPEFSGRLVMLYGELVQHNPELAQNLSFLQPAYALMSVFLDKLILYENMTNFSVEDLFDGASQTQKLIQMLKMPGLIEVLLQSFNTNKFAQLLNTGDMTTAFSNLCSPISSLDQFLTIPDGVTIDLSLLKTRLCGLNFEHLVHELSNFVDVSRLTAALNGSLPVNYEALSEQYNRSMTMMQRLMVSPPTFTMPPALLNDSFWMGMLHRYGSTRQDPSSMMQELERVTDKLGVLMTSDSLKQVPKVAQTILQLVNENLVALPSKNLNLQNLAQRVPIVQDVLSALGAQGEVLDAMMEAPVQSSQMLLEALLTDGTEAQQTVCNITRLRELLQLPASFDSTALYQAVCRKNTTQVVNSLIQNLDLQQLLVSLNSPMSAANWSSVFQQSRELQQNIQKLFMNPPVFNVSNLLMELKRTFNTSDLWQMSSLFSHSTLLDALGTVPQLQGLQSVIKSTGILVEFLDDLANRLVVDGVTVDLASLFSSSPSFIRLMNATLKTQPDIITAMSTIQVYPTKISEIQVLALRQYLLPVLCAPGQFEKYFLLPAGINMTAVLNVLCSLDYTQLTQELKDSFVVDALTKKFGATFNGSKSLNLQKYVSNFINLTNNIIRLSGAQNVKFDDIDLRDALSVNATRLLNSLEDAAALLQSQLTLNHAQFLENSLGGLASVAEGRTVIYALKVVGIYMQGFNAALQNITSGPISLAAILNNTEVGKIVSPFLHKPSSLQDLLNLELLPEKLQLLLMNREGAMDTLCGPQLFTVFAAPGNQSSVLQQLQASVCSSNKTLMMWQSIMGQAAGYQLYKQMKLLSAEMEAGKIDTKVGDTNSQLQQLIGTIMKLAAEYENGTRSGDDVLDWRSFKNIFSEFSSSIGQRLTNMSQQWSLLLANAWLMNSPDSAVSDSNARVMKVYTVILDVINNRLDDMITSDISLHSLLNHSESLVKLMEAFLDVAKMTPQGWLDRQFVLNKLVEVSSNKTLLAQQCTSQTLDRYIAVYASVSTVTSALQTALCSLTTELPQTFTQVIDYQALQTQIADILNTNATVQADHQQFIRAVVRYNQLIAKLATTPPSVDHNLAGKMDFTNMLRALQNIVEDPNKIFQVLKAVGIVMDGPLRSNDMDNILYRIHSHVAQPLLVLVNSMNKVGVSLSSVMQNPAKLLDALPVLMDFDMHFDVIAASYLQPMMNRFWNNQDFRSRHLCNDTIAPEVVLSTGLSASMVNTLCAVPTTEWISTLQKLNATEPQIIAWVEKVNEMYRGVPRCYDTMDMVNGTVSRSYICHLHNADMFDNKNMYWMRLMATLQSVASGLTPDGSKANGAVVGESLSRMWVILKDAFLNKSLASAMRYMEMVDHTGQNSAQWIVFKHAMRFLQSAGNLLNSGLHRMTGPSGTVYLKDLLPDSQKVADLLQKTMGSKSMAEILTAAVNPQLFYQLAYPGKLKSTACDPVQFSALFVFPAGTNVAAIQKALCKALSNHSTNVQGLLDLFQAGDMLMQLDRLLNNKITNETKELSLWQTLTNTVSSLLTNVEQLQNKHINTSAGNWMDPITGQFSTLGQPFTDNLESMCQSFGSLYGGSDDFQSWKMILPQLARYTSIVSKIAPHLTRLDDLTCSMVTNQGLNLSAGLDFLKQHGLTNLLQTMSAVLGNNAEGSLQCGEFAQAVSQLYSWFNTLGQVPSPIDGHYMAQCIHQGLPQFAEVLEGFNRLYQVLEGISSLLRDEDIMTLMQNSEGLTQIVDFVLSLVGEENAVAVVQFTDLMNSSTDVESYLTHTVHLAPDLVKTLLSSTINSNAGNFLNRSASEIAAVLCDPELLGQIISLPDSSVFSMSALSQYVCTHNVSLTAAMLHDAQQSPQVINQLMAIMMPGARGQFVSNLTTTVVDLFSKFKSVSSMIGMMGNGFDLNFLKENADTIDTILADGDTFGKTVHSLSSLVETLKYMLPPENHSIIPSIKTFISGILGLDLVRSRLNAAVRVSDLQKNASAVNQYLTSELFFSPQAAAALLNSTYSVRMFFNESGLLLSEMPCESRLQQVIVLDTTQSLREEITGRFCSLSTTQLTEFMELMVPQLDIGSLVQKYVASTKDSFLTSANITETKLRGMLSSLSEGAKALEHAAGIFSDDSSLASKVFRDRGPHEGETASLLSLQPVLCGMKGKMDDHFNLNSKMQGALSQKDAEEEAQLKGEFCKGLYRTVKNTKMGSVIWTYIKPIMFGKILYTPDISLTRNIIENANWTFSTLSEVRRVAKLWSQKVHHLTNLTDVASEMSTLQSTLNNKFVIGILQSTLGVDSHSVLQGLDTASSSSMNSSDMRSLQMVAELLYNYTSCLELDRFEAVSDEAELSRRAFELHTDHLFLGGIVFLNLEDDGIIRREKRQAGDSIMKLPSHIMYKIRMDMDNVPTTNRIKDRLWKPDAEDNFASDLRYMRGFVQLQDMVEGAILRLQAGSNYTTTGVLLQQMPFPCHREDDYIHYLGSYLLPVLMTFAWLAAIGIATHNLVYDRQSGQEESLRIMGMVPGLNFVSWLAVTMLLMGLVSMAITAIFKFSGIFHYSSCLLIFLYLLDFCFSTTMMCYMISSFFNRTTLAILTVLILYFISFLPYAVFIGTEVKMNFWQKSLTSLSSTTAFSFGAMFLTRFEEETSGLQWSNIDKNTGDAVNFSWMCYMMLIDSFIYLIVGWYIRNVKPGAYGVRQPWYFLVSANYWSSWLAPSVQTPPPASHNTVQGPFQQPPEGLDVGISVRDLRKKYGKKTEVVHGVDVDIYHDQVTTLLGHNGAAKTTMLNMLMGVLHPTSGTVLVEGKKTDGRTGLLGVCQQHNTLFDFMTVEEHMNFYGGIKGRLPARERKKEIDKLLQDVDLSHMKDVPVRNLSGGMQRRLCVALAFVGGSKTLILDEPTSGVDPHARKNIWNLIMKNRMGRTILMSTHHMDEADILSDRILVMHTGRLLSVGSANFLKEQLGDGYKITLNTSPVVNTVNEAVASSPSLTADEMSSQHFKVLAYIQSNLPASRFVESVGADLTVSLPHCSSNGSQFCGFFKQLDAQSNKLGVLSYGVSNTTLEEVFLKLTTDANAQSTSSSEDHEASTPSTTTESVTTDDNSTVPEPSSGQPKRTVKGAALKLQQLGALIVKRLHHYRRNWRMAISTMLLPLLAFLCAMGFSTMRPVQDNMQNLLLSPALYTQAAPESFAFFKDNSGSQWSQLFIDTLTATSPGIGTTCIGDYDHGPEFKCVNPGQMYSSHKTAQSCTCKDFVFECQPSSETEGVKQMMTRPKLILQDLGSKDINRYLIDTYSNYINQRYGGWSLEPPAVSGNITTPLAKVWFNNKGHHAIPSYFNALSNNLLRSAVSPAYAPRYGITLYNHPLMLNTEQLSEKSIESGATDVGVALVVLLALSFVPSAFMVFLTNEKVSQEKHLQSLSGVSTLLYWSASFIWDMFVYSCAVGIMVIIIVIFKSEGFYDRENLAAFAALVILYGFMCLSWAVIPLMYCTLRLFKTGSSAYLILFCANMLIGLFTSISLFVFSLMKFAKGIQALTKILKCLFLIFPQYSLGMGLVEIVTNQFQYRLLKRFGEDTYVSPFAMNMLGWKLLVLALQGFLFLLLTFFIHSRKERIVSMTSGLHYNSATDDRDVFNEKERVQSGGSHDVLAVKDLCKVYQRGQIKFCAVNHLSFGLNKGECFGLLGVNGAGKTTTFKMLTGAIGASEGDAVIQNKLLSKLRSHLGDEMGYCPQEDALDMYLSGREMLLFHARLRGFDSQQADMLVTRQLKQLHLESLQNKAVHTYSGGNKRKLSLAIAMLGEPPLLLLDEPTTGMDAATRRLAWKCITQATQRGQSVLLTSHSMDECDALCSRLAIMVNGQLKCLGSPQHLKHKFGEGYSLGLHLHDPNSHATVTEFFLSRFPGAKVKDRHHNVVEISIPREQSSVADIFTALLDAQAAHQIEYYSVSQTTLDSVFVSFAREQTDDGEQDSDLESSSASSSSSSNDGDSTSIIKNSSIHIKSLTDGSFTYLNPDYSDTTKDHYSVTTKDKLADNPTIITPKQNEQAYDNISTFLE